MDGANEAQVYRHIVIPLLQPVTLSVVIILGHISLKIYDLVVSMTGSGPGFATDVPALNMWKTTFDATLFAQGAAIGVVLLVLVAVLIIPYLRYSIRAEALPPARAEAAHSCIDRGPKDRVAFLIPLHELRCR